jgi:hypothetical protein
MHVRIHKHKCIQRCTIPEKKQIQQDKELLLVLIIAKQANQIFARIENQMINIANTSFVHTYLTLYLAWQYNHFSYTCKFRSLFAKSLFSERLLKVIFQKMALVATAGLSGHPTTPSK